MTEICINTSDDLDIDHIGWGSVLNENMEETLVSVKVLEKITYEEYYEFVKIHNLTHLITPSIGNKRFYRVQILD